MHNLSFSYISSYISLILATTIWGFGFVAVKESVTHITPIQVLFIRFFSSAFFLIIIYYNSIRSSRLQTIKRGFILGFFLFLAFWTQTIGIFYTTPGKNAFLTSTNVVIVPFLYWLIRGKKPKFFHIVSALLCVLGVFLLSYSGDAFYLNKGDFFSLLCALFFGFHIVFTDIFIKNDDLINLSFWQFLTVSLISLLLILIKYNFVWFKNLVFIIIGEKNKRLLFSLVYICLFSTLLAYILQTYSQKFIKPYITSIILSTEAIWGYLASYLLYKEDINLPTILGCGLILSSAIIVSLIDLKTN